MKVVFRTDASVQIGTGHVMRCLNVAEVLREQGIECYFITRDHPGNIQDLISKKGYQVFSLENKPNFFSPTKSSHEKKLDHSEWLGVSQEQDAIQCKEILKEIYPDWIVVDHYGLDAYWENSLRDFAGQILVIDDLADRHHDCDLLLDQNVMSRSIEEKYKALVPEHCKLLLGPKYALINQEYSRLRSTLPERDGPVSRVLIFVGGSDHYGLTEKYFDVLCLKEYLHIRVDIVLGNRYSREKVINEKADKRGNSKVYRALPSLAPLMMKSDLMLGGGGITNWERMCLGLPAIVSSIAKNQVSTSEKLSELDCIYYLGESEYLACSTIREAMDLFVNNKSNIKKLSCINTKFVDGHGISRLISYMELS